MEISFRGKRALVTGAARGIGKEITKRLVECGAEVVAVARTQENLDNLKKEISNIKTICVDLSDWEATKKALSTLDQIDLLVNNAGIMERLPFDKVTEGNCDRLFAVNVKAAINVSQIVSAQMKKSGKGGSIVNVSSVASLRGVANLTAYCCSKGALDSLTEVMATELGPFKIRVNSVNPQLVYTDMVKDRIKDTEYIQRRIENTPLRRLCGFASELQHRCNFVED